MVSFILSGEEQEEDLKLSSNYVVLVENQLKETALPSCVAEKQTRIVSESYPKLFLQ
jgi:hypothetical protein